MSYWYLTDISKESKLKVTDDIFREKQNIILEYFSGTILSDGSKFDDKDRETKLSIINSFFKKGGIVSIGTAE